MKYIVITGGVISGIGKGIAASSIGAILQGSGKRVTMIKIDPYVNVDAGTMSPYEHGEVFVLNDGGETDLDLGNYERFLGITLTNKHNITTGKVYKSVITKERKGEYLGETVQIIPHVRDEIISFIKDAATTNIIYDLDGKHTPEICIIELGGTVGDIESLPFIEALREMQFRSKDCDMCFVHVSLVPTTGLNNEPKTKPTQNSVNDLRRLGMKPDVMILRCEEGLDGRSKEKISLFCQVPKKNIFINKNVTSIYQVPLQFDEQNIGEILCENLDVSFERGMNYLVPMKNYVSLYSEDLVKVNIAIVGKYTKLTDSYLSIVNALEHAAYQSKHRVSITWVSSESIDYNAINMCHGVIIPGGFGKRGIDGMVDICNYCRTKNKPMLGICLGMHVMCIEAARKVLGDGCNSEEFDPCAKHQIVKIVNRTQNNIGGSMKLGIHKTRIKQEKEVGESGKTIAYKAYNQEIIEERHRHRYEVNAAYIKTLSACLSVSGTNEQEECVDIVESSTKHDFYIGCQYHPEFLSLLNKPSPLFVAFIEASMRSQINDLL